MWILSSPCLADQTTVVEDVYMADALVSQVETAMGRKKKIGFGLIIEATMGTFDNKTRHGWDGDDDDDDEDDDDDDEVDHEDEDVYTSQVFRLVGFLSATVWWYEMI